MWFKLNLRSNKSARSSRRDISSILAGRIVWINFQDRKRAACSSPTGRMEHVFIWGKSFRWYIKHQSKVSFPLTFLVLSPSNRHSPLYSAHIHTQDQKQNKQRPFKYQPTCLLCDWRSYCTAQPGLVQPAAATWTALWGPTLSQLGSNSCMNNSQELKVQRECLIRLIILFPVLFFYSISLVVGPVD